MFPAEKKKGKANQPQGQERCIDVVGGGGQLYSTDVIPPDFEARFARGEFATKDRSLCLENLLWQQSSTVLRGAQEIAWKASFTAACIRKIRQRTSSLSEETEASQSTVTRWTIAAWMINLIVDGLWPTWGPKAALIYEALALKNYSLSRIVRFFENTLRQIIQGVVNNLKDSTPLVLGSTYVFHPAACISSALSISYEETCLDLGLKRSFSKLDPPQNLQSHTLLSLLLDQWDRYLATLPVGPVASTWGYNGGGASQFDALTAVVQSILATDHLHHSVDQSSPVDMPTALVESFAVENADAEQSVCRDSQQDCSQTNAFNSQHTNYSTLSIRDQWTHLAGSASALGALASYSDMPTDSTLHGWVVNGPQGVDEGPDTRMDVEREALHLWQADDLANYPHLYEPIDLGWGDSLGDGADQGGVLESGEIPRCD